MMPPVSQWRDAEGHVIPFPDAILVISGNRYLSNQGEIFTSDQPWWHAGRETVTVTEDTRHYWEGRAAVAGFTLEELLA